MNIKRKKSAMIFIPHPDDLEFLVNHETQYFIKHEYQIYEIMMTWGEMGLRRYKKIYKNISKKKIKKIRKIENKKAKNIFNQIKNKKQDIITIPMNFSDSALPISRNSLKKIQKVIQKLKPKFILIPDPIYPIDCHPDHINTGKLVILALKSFKTNSYLKKILLYETFKPNIFLPIQSWKIWKKSFLCHESQFSSLFISILSVFMKLNYLFFGKQRIPLRKINSKNIENNKNKKSITLSIFDSILLNFFLLLTNKKFILKNKIRNKINNNLKY